MRIFVNLQFGFVCGSNIYQISGRGYSVCGLTYKTSMLLYPPPLRFSHFLIQYFNSFFYLVGDLYFSLFFFVIISSLGWSFLIRIRYFLKYKVFWLNYYVSIQLRSCITNWKFRFSLLFSIWLLNSLQIFCLGQGWSRLCVSMGVFFISLLVY